MTDVNGNDHNPEMFWCEKDLMRYFTTQPDDAEILARYVRSDLCVEPGSQDIILRNNELCGTMNDSTGTVWTKEQHGLHDEIDELKRQLQVLQR